MADNRIYLRCKACGEVMYLGKRFGGAYYYENYAKWNYEHGHRDPITLAQWDKTLGDFINEFFNEHFICNGYVGGLFEIVYEIPDYEDMVDEGNNFNDFCYFKNGGLLLEKVEEDG